MAFLWHYSQVRIVNNKYIRWRADVNSEYEIKLLSKGFCMFSICSSPHPVIPIAFKSPRIFRLVFGIREGRQVKERPKSSYLIAVKSLAIPRYKQYFLSLCFGNVFMIFFVYMSLSKNPCYFLWKPQGWRRRKNLTIAFELEAQQLMIIEKFA